jgi:hypothetical protein
MRVQFAASARLQHSVTPPPLFEHQDDFDASGEGHVAINHQPRAESFRPWVILLRPFHGNRSIVRAWHRRPDDPGGDRALAYIELLEVAA